MNTSRTTRTGLSWLTLFAASGTLICCALPIVLVTLGMGATVAALTSNLPILVALSLHKTWVFAGSGTLLVISGWLLYRPTRRCPNDPGQGQLCDRTQVWNRRVFLSSAAVWIVGFMAAYLALPMRIFLDL